MPTLPRKQTLLLILILLLSSCAPRPTPSRVQAIEQNPTSAQTIPISTLVVSTATQKTPHGTKAPSGQQGQGSDASQPLNFDIPAHPFDVILGRPTSDSITLSVLSATAQDVTIAYGAESGTDTTQTSATLQPNIPATVEFSNLQPDLSITHK